MRRLTKPFARAWKPSNLEIPVESISSQPAHGLYEVNLKGSRVLYASADGQYIVQGYLFQIQGRQAGQPDREGRTPGDFQD